MKGRKKRRMRSMKSKTEGCGVGGEEGGEGEGEGGKEEGKGGGRGRKEAETVKRILRKWR